MQSELRTEDDSALSCSSQGEKRATGRYRHWVSDTDASASVTNSQEPGIGRLTVCGNLIAINNLGRNIQFCHSIDGDLVTNCLYDATVYPDSDDDSQFDLDFHAFLNMKATGAVLAINHYGIVRSFRTERISNHGRTSGSSATGVRPQLSRAGTAPRLTEDLILRWQGDVECACIASNLLVGTSPRGYRVPDQAQPGIIVSDLAALEKTCSSPESILPNSSLQLPALPHKTYLESWGYTTALAFDERSRQIAVAAGDRIGVFHLDDTLLEASFQAALQDTTAPFLVDWLQFTDDGGGLIAAGYGLEYAQINECAWDKIGSGGWMKLSLTGDKGAVARGDFLVDLAWGNGAVPLCLSADERSIFAMDKHAGLHEFDLHSNAHTPLTEPQSRLNIGLAHMIRHGDLLVCGFNRDGYRLHFFRES